MSKSKRRDWAVYEHARGAVWSIAPATKANAKKEARLVGAGHEAMPLDRARALANAWNTGRMYEVQVRRAQ